MDLVVKTPCDVWLADIQSHDPGWLHWALGTALHHWTVGVTTPACDQMKQQRPHSSYPSQKTLQSFTFYEKNNPTENPLTSCGSLYSSTPPTGSCVLGFGVLGTGLRMAEAGWTKSALRIKHRTCALSIENIWAQQLTATHLNLFLRGKENGESQLDTAPNVLFFFVQKGSRRPLKKLI